jgi:hypothetical protein
VRQPEPIEWVYDEKTPVRVDAEADEAVPPVLPH